MAWKHNITSLSEDLCGSCALDTWRLTEGICRSNSTLLSALLLMSKLLFFVLTLKEVAMKMPGHCAVYRKIKLNKKKWLSEVNTAECYFCSVCNKSFLFLNSIYALWRKKQTKILHLLTLFLLQLMFQMSDVASSIWWMCCLTTKT